MDIVSEHRFVIISGVPGIGKTTLADMLLFAHLEAGYQPVILKSDIAEGRPHFNNEARQIFYFDDFLGETFLGNRHDFLGKKEDSAILDFMELITRSKNARLILTTREHILRHAFQISERFRRRENGLVENRFVLQLDDYTVLDRGRILYNHIYFSDLPAPYKRALIKDAFYMEVLRHRNYNPRLVEWLSRFANVRATPVGSYPREIRRVLEHPEELWRLAFEQQISEASRSALLGLYSLDGKARLEELEIVWRALHRNRAEKYHFRMAAEDWRRALQEMEGGFLAFDSGNVSFVNPSVRDFLDATIVSTPDHLEDILASSVRFRQVVSIWRLAESEKAEGVSQSLRRYMEHLIASASRNLQKPYEIKIDFGKGSYGIRDVDTRPEERLQTMLSIAVATGSEAAVIAVEDYSSEVVKSWKSRSPEYRSAVILLRRVAEASDRYSGMSAVHDRLKTALLRELGHNAQSDDIVAMIEYADEAAEDHWHPSDQQLLVKNARKYLDDDFDDEVRNAADNDQHGVLQGLYESVEVIGRSCDIAVSVFLDQINQKIGDASEDRADDRPVHEWEGGAEKHSDSSQEDEVVRLFDGLVVS